MKIEGQKIPAKKYFSPVGSWLKRWSFRLLIGIGGVVFVAVVAVMARRPIQRLWFNTTSRVAADVRVTTGINGTWYNRVTLWKNGTIMRQGSDSEYRVRHYGVDFTSSFLLQLSDIHANEEQYVTCEIGCTSDCPQYRITADTLSSVVELSDQTVICYIAAHPDSTISKVLKAEF